MPIVEPRPPTALPPSGAAGGDLSGTYPNPDIASGVIVNADINGSAAIAISKLAPIAESNVTNLSTDLATLTAYAQQGFAGAIVPFTASHASSSGPLSASRGYVVRFVSPATMTITSMSFVTTVAAGANDNCDAGIFNSALTTLLGSSGSTAGKLNATAGVQTVPMQAGIPLVQGTVYYAALAVGTFGGSAVSVVVTAMAGGNAANMFGATAGFVTQTFQNSAFPLAAPFTVGGNVGSVPVLAVKT